MIFDHVCICVIKCPLLGVSDSTDLKGYRFTHFVGEHMHFIDFVLIVDYDGEEEKIIFCDNDGNESVFNNRII
jgi:hypothetical protein